MIINKQGSTVKKCKIYFQEEEIEIVKLSKCLALGSHSLIQVKKHKAIENLLTKASEA